MIQTKYEYEIIKKFRKKYKWLIWSYQIFYPLILIFMLLRIHVIIPNQCDTFGYFDKKLNYYYFFGIKDCI